MIAAALLAALLLAALGARLAIARAAAPLLPPAAPAPPPTAILLPVRDEAGEVADCVASLLAQTAPARVRVVDDHSTDATPAILERLRAAAPRLELAAARPLPAGWGGKVNALESGRAGLDEPWLLLTDADTRHAPDLLARAHAAVAEHALDALSLAGRQQARGAERLLVPAVFALLDLLLGDWRPHAAGRGAPVVANGQFFLIRRELLERAGGFAAVAGLPLDDVLLARNLAAAGGRVGFRRAGAALAIRMYRGLGAALAGWRRNLALFLGPRQLLRALALALAPPLLLAVALARGAWLAASVLAVGGAVGSALAREGRDRLWAPLWPLELLLLAATLALAALDRARGRTRWRGREIPIPRRSGE